MTIYSSKPVSHLLAFQGLIWTFISVHFYIFVECLLWVWVLGLSGLKDGGIFSRTRIVLQRSSVGSWVSTFMKRDAPEQFQIVIGVADLEKSCLTWVQHPQFQSLRWILRYPALYFTGHLSYTLLIFSGKGWDVWLAVPRGSFLIISSNCCQLSSVP